MFKLTDQSYKAVKEMSKALSYGTVEAKEISLASLAVVG